jgi:hypothetical protein
MLKPVSLIILAMLSGFTVLQKNGDTKSWNAKAKLKWADFRGFKSASSVFPVASSIHLHLHYKKKKGGISYYIECLFKKEYSWATVQTAALLSHEQGHFDIGEIYSRTFRKSLFENPGILQESNGNRLDSLYHTVTKQLDLRQDEYDSCTGHSTDTIQQKKWNQLIEMDLIRLRSFNK